MLNYNTNFDRSMIKYDKVEALMLFGNTGVGKSTLATAISLADLEVEESG